MRLKLKAKILIIFISSIILSVIIFLFAISYLINNGWWAGITTTDMNIAADGATSQIQKIDSFNYVNVKSILNSWKDKYNGMELELLSNKLELIYTTASKQQIGTMGELMQGLSEHGHFSQKRWVVAREIDMASGGKSYLVVVVPSEYFTSISLSINGLRGAGIFGKMFLIGLGITLVISSVFAYIFTKGISKRFTTLYKGISSFELGNLDITIDDNSHDEIGDLAVTFNKMSGRLKKQIDMEKSYNEERKKLVSNISHDLRSPLTSIIGYSESLENKIYEDEQEKNKYIQIIRKKSLYMEKLLGELLEFSRLESGKVELKRQKIDMAELVREILIEYLPVIHDYKMELKADISENSLMANVDRDGISRVLRNLMDNAVKYGRDGNVIEFSLIDEHDTLRIDLKDNGHGIDSKNLDMIFNRFYREDRSRNTKDGGMGLGLAIADEIVKIHDGKIYVQSVLGKGSTFTVILPKLC